MLRRENELRLYDEGVQERFRIAESTSSSDWMEVADQIQRQVLREFGIQPHHMVEGLRQLRSAALRHPELAIYVRFNRCERGSLREGDPCPNIVLYDLEGRRQKLLVGGGGGNRKLAILAGSYS
jgi:hypothetical protein